MIHLVSFSFLAIFTCDLVSSLLIISCAIISCAIISCAIMQSLVAQMPNVPELTCTKSFVWKQIWITQLNLGAEPASMHFFLLLKPPP